MESNNITEEYVKKAQNNRKIRTELFEKIRSCHNKLIMRNEAIKSIIQYTAIYLTFSVVNIGIAAMELNSIAPIILGGLTIGYGLAVFNDVAVVIKNKPDEIYKLIKEYNDKLSDLDNEYLDFSNKIEKQNVLNSKNSLYFDVKDNKITKDINKEVPELFLSHFEDEKCKVKKYGGK